MKTHFLLPSTVQLLRFHFSLFLMPVYWFALSEPAGIHPPRAILVFVILHLLVYPASNGYNSYMDRDTGSIGGIKRPLQPTRELLYITVLMNAAALVAGCFVSLYFAVGILFYIFASMAYSYRGIRLKKYPVWGYLTVVFFQGAFTFALVYHGCSAPLSLQPPVTAMLLASLLIGGFYPMTQIYQYDADLKDGVETISYRLGYRGTFIYSGILYLIAMLVSGIYFFEASREKAFYILGAGLLPVGLYFLFWARKVWQDPAKADYQHTMRMNTIAATCANFAFIVIFIANRYE
ncbi:MAG: UbiA family prenyltransferase [Chitinophagaceae bacterium]|nr:UbiA family prenyltransferase [Chitinophagaceae bacterium]